eukprot:Rmarinus@m.8057
MRVRAGCIPYRVDIDAKPQVLLITSRKHPGQWILPIGGVEDGEDIVTAAVREAMEEAGVTGAVSMKVGAFDDKSKGWRAHLFALRVKSLLDEGAWPESHERQRQWFSFDDAESVLQPRPILLGALKTLKQRMWSRRS